jgi:hypothetical protein
VKQIIHESKSRSAHKKNSKEVNLQFATQQIKSHNMEDKKNQTDNSTSSDNTTPKVTGIGGIFFYSDNVKETKDWYTKNLGKRSNHTGRRCEL